MICLESFQSADDGITCSSGHFICQNDLPSVCNTPSLSNSYLHFALITHQILILSMCVCMCVFFSSLQLIHPLNFYSFCFLVPIRKRFSSCF